MGENQQGFAEQNAPGVSSSMLLRFYVVDQEFLCPRVDGSEQIRGWGNRQGGEERGTLEREGNAGNERGEETNSRKPRDLNSFAMTSGAGTDAVRGAHGSRMVGGRWIWPAVPTKKKGGLIYSSLYLS
jgi:hypothetical protein